VQGAERAGDGRVEFFNKECEQRGPASKVVDIFEWILQLAIEGVGAF
jgi:hypothetical protein